MPKESTCQISFCQTFTTLVYYLILLILFWILLRLPVLSFPLRHVRKFLNFFVDKVTNARAHISPPAFHSSVSSLLTAFCLFESLYLPYMRLLVIESLQVPPTDAVPLGFFKEVISVLEPSVPGLINSSLSSGVVPKTFKHATLLIKNPARMPLLSNFRPVSKLPFFSKILEKIVYSQWTAL